jgi:hypothetical protein
MLTVLINWHHIQLSYEVVSTNVLLSHVFVATSLRHSSNLKIDKYASKKLTFVVRDIFQSSLGAVLYPLVFLGFRLLSISPDFVTVTGYWF